MKVRIPTPLRSYTGNQATVDVAGTTLGDLVDDLDRQYPGIGFRMVDEQGRLRQHMIIFVNGERVRDLSTPVADQDDVALMQVLSGG